VAQAYSGEKFIHFSLALLFVFTTAFASAQFKQTHRFEVKQKGSDEYFSIISLKEEGLALLRERNKYEDGKQLWELIFLDSALQQKATIDLPIENRYTLIGFEYVPGRLYLLYRTGDTNKNSLEVIEFNTSESREKIRYQIKPELDFKLTHFSKVGSNIVMGGYVSNEPAVLLYDVRDGQIKVVPGFFQKDNELVDLRVNQNQTFNAVIIDRSNRSERQLIFKTFDETGKLLLEDLIPIGEDRSLQTSISSSLIREDLLVLGTWGERQGKQSSGFFSLPVDPFSEQKISFTSFGELEHFTDYLNPKRAQRIKENTQADVLQGRLPSFSAYVMPFKVEEHAEGYLLLAEVYTPSNNTNPYYSSPYSNPYYYNPYYYNPYASGYYPGMRMYRPYHGNNVKNAEEIKTYASVLVAFDANGKIKWDQAMKLEETKRPSLDQVADYYYSNPNVYFIYKKESDLMIKTIAISDGATEEKVEKIKLNESHEEIRSEKEYEDGVRHWVGNTFYIWGYHTVRNAEHKDDRNRDIFYINKAVVR
jgi:hypothetical protein